MDIITGKAAAFARRSHMTPIRHVMIVVVPLSGDHTPGGA